jgi:hypothetical protein
VPGLRRNFGGCAGNIAYNLKLLGGRPAGLMGWSRRPGLRGVVAPSWATLSGRAVLGYRGGRAVLSGVGGRAVLGYGGGRAVLSAYR